MKLYLLCFFLCSIVLLSTPVFAEQATTKAYLFYGQGCPHCAQAIQYLESLQESHNISLKRYEVYHNNTSRSLFEQMSNAYGTSIQGVPTLFIHNKTLVGFGASTKNEIETLIHYCKTNPCEDPKDRLTPSNPSGWARATIPAVVSAALVDAINPCAFAVLIILLTTILASKRKKRALGAGIAFTLAIYISYFLMGIGLFTAITTAGITHTFFTIVALLAIVLGLFNLKDYLWYGKWFVTEVPRSWRPKLKKLIRGVTSIPGAFLIGFAVSLFLLPCTSGPYIVILGLLAKAATKHYALGLLFLYNAIFVLPMLLITLAVYFGFTNTEQAEQWRTKRLKVLHLIAGIIMLLLGAGMLVSISLGII